MGQKVNPVGLRLGINRTWDSRWYANTGEYGKLLHEDLKIREYLEKELKQAAVSKIVIERPHKKCRVTIHAARPWPLGPCIQTVFAADDRGPSGRSRG